MNLGFTIFKISCYGAVPVFILAFLAEIKAGFLNALVNGLIMGGIVIAGGFAWLMFSADIESMNRPSITRKEMQEKEIDALMGAAATDDKLWRDFWGD